MADDCLHGDAGPDAWLDRDACAHYLWRADRPAHHSALLDLNADRLARSVGDPVALPDAIAHRVTDQPGVRAAAG